MNRQELQQYRDAMRLLLPAGETSRRAFYGGVLRHQLLAKRPIWTGSPTVVDGAERISFDPGAVLLVGLASFGLTSTSDTSVIRVREGASFHVGGRVALQRGIRIVVDSGRLSIGNGTNLNGLGTKVLCAESVTIGSGCTFSWDVQVLDNDFHAITVDGAQQPALLSPGSRPRSSAVRTAGPRGTRRLHRRCAPRAGRGSSSSAR
ncbi:MAG: acyltransferase [Actinobacteria bacterium]|nr:acyltransferase [Actinomycetota bacterium]